MLDVSCDCLVAYSNENIWRRQLAMISRREDAVELDD